MMVGLSFLFGMTVLPAQAAIPALYTNNNFFTSEYDSPVSFVQDALGNFSGVTETGKTFYQRSVVVNISVHLHHFAIDDAYFYISSYGIILAESDTAALSIYLTRVA